MLTQELSILHELFATNDDRNDFLGEKGNKNVHDKLIMLLPLKKGKRWLSGVDVSGWIDCYGTRERTIDKAHQTLSVKERNDLVFPK